MIGKYWFGVIDAVIVLLALASCVGVVVLIRASVFRAKRMSMSAIETSERALNTVQLFTRTFAGLDERLGKIEREHDRNKRTK